jgi:hypothetical protein
MAFLLSLFLSQSEPLAAVKCTQIELTSAIHFSGKETARLRVVLSAAFSPALAGPAEYILMHYVKVRWMEEIFNVDLLSFHRG